MRPAHLPARPAAAAVLASTVVLAGLLVAEPGQAATSDRKPRRNGRER